SALVVFLAASRRQIVRRAFRKAALGLEISEGLRRERNEFVQAGFARFVFDELNEFAANALVLVRRIDVQKSQLPLAMLWIRVQGDAGDRVLINLEEIIIAQILLNAGAGALDELIARDGILGQH